MKLNQIINFIEYDEIINPITDLEILNVKKPDEADEQSIIFLFRKIKTEFKINSKVIVTKEKIDDYEYCQIIHKNPRLAMAQVIELLFPAFEKPLKHDIHENIALGNNVHFSEPILIGPFCNIGNNVIIKAGTKLYGNISIGNNCKIGENCIIHSNVTIYDNSVIGNNTILHSGVVIGADGFGYEENKGNWQKINHIGTVEIGNNVEIGANSCVDRGALGKTIIKDRVKIDNLVQVAHNCEVGSDTLIVAGALLGGSSKVGERCIIAGDVCVSDGIILEDGTTVLARSGVTKNHKGNQILSGYPAINHREESKFQAKLRRFLKSNN